MSLQWEVREITREIARVWDVLPVTDVERLEEEPLLTVVLPAVVGRALVVPTPETVARAKRK